MDPTLVSLATLGAVAGTSIGVGLGWGWGRRRYQRISAELIDTRDRYTTALRQQHTQAALFRALFDAAPECIKLQGVDGRVQRINSAGLALLETTRAERIVGESVFSVMAPEYHRAYRELTDQVFAGRSGCMEFELITYAGRRRWLETHAVPLRDASDTIVSLLAITRDIDDRKRMTRLLEEQRCRLQTIIESEPECVKLHDRDGVIVEMNPAGLALLNATRPDQVLGRTVYEFIEEEYREPYRQLTEQVFAGERRRMEFQASGIDGRRRWLETHATPLYDAGGKVGALLAITRDINERKLNEVKLRRQHNELAHVCRLSTLGELASGLAHEINQPLCAISSYAESAVLLNGRSEGRAAEDIDTLLGKIVAQTERASGIIARLRELVRRHTPKAKANAPLSLIREVLEFIDAERRRCRVSIDVISESDLHPVWVDRVQIEQVLINLLFNAMQAIHDSHDAEKRIDVRLRGDEEQVEFEIRDYADGITPVDRDRLFTAFFTTKPNGLGMGLAISRSIAEAHHGQLNYRPASPGSLFMLRLPCRVHDS